MSDNIKITVEGKEAIRFVLEAIEEKISSRKCQFCGEYIYEDNFGIIFKKKLVCSNPLCIIQKTEVLDYKGVQIITSRDVPSREIRIYNFKKPKNQDWMV